MKVSRDHGKNKTVHVIPSAGGWTVRREGRASGTFSTQAGAIKAARDIVRSNAVGQFVVLERDGQIVKHVTHGLPKVQNPPGKSGTKNKIQDAAGRVVLERFGADSYPPRD